MTWSERRRHLRVYINGSMVRTSAPNITASLSLAPRTAEFNLASRPGIQPARGDTVLIKLIADDLDKSWDIYGGKIDALEVESEPWAYYVRCVDQLELLRATHKGTDMQIGRGSTTDGEEWAAILSYCEIDFELDDMVEAGIILGTRMPLYWHNDSSTTGGQVLSELDTMTGCATITVGNNRVIRIAPDYVPETDTGSYKTLEKGVNADWVSHRRAQGSRDDIQNVWRARGASVELNSSCTATPWAFAVDGNAQIGRKVRTPEQSITSDFIQDEQHARRLVEQSMRRFNKVPDLATITMELDPNVHPGTKLVLVDPTYGIMTPALGRIVLVTSVTIDGLLMTCEAEAGPGGDLGTITTGVDKVCGDTHTNPDWPGDFEFPEPTFPPLDLGDPGDFSSDFDVSIPEWEVPDFEPNGICEPFVETPTDCDTGSFADGQELSLGYPWEIGGTLTLTNSEQVFQVEIDTDDGTWSMRIAGSDFYDPMIGSFLYELRSPHQHARLVGQVPLDAAHVWKLNYDPEVSTMYFYCEVGEDICYVDAVSDIDSTMEGAVLDINVTGTPTRSGEYVSENCGAEDEPPPDPDPSGFCVEPVFEILEGDESYVNVGEGIGEVTITAEPVSEGSLSGSVITTLESPFIISGGLIPHFSVDGFIRLATDDCSGIVTVTIGSDYVVDIYIAGSGTRSDGIQTTGVSVGEPVTSPDTPTSFPIGTTFSYSIEVDQANDEVHVLLGSESFDFTSAGLGGLTGDDVITIGALFTSQPFDPTPGSNHQTGLNRLEVTEVCVVGYDVVWDVDNAVFGGGVSSNAEFNALDHQGIHYVTDDGDFADSPGQTTATGQIASEPFILGNVSMPPLRIVGDLLVGDPHYRLDFIVRRGASSNMARILITGDMYGRPQDSPGTTAVRFDVAGLGTNLTLSGSLATPVPSTIMSFELILDTVAGEVSLDIDGLVTYSASGWTPGGFGTDYTLRVETSASTIPSGPYTPIPGNNCGVESLVVLDL
jgi:hypothetical protein